MSEPLTLMIVHAHPDDEAIGTGGVLAKYAADGRQTVLVTCTLGEEGEIVVPELDTPENHAVLHQIRHAELLAAVAHLEVGALEILPYRDSGMIGTPANEHPDSFNRADFDEATGRLTALVRRYRPQVLVSYNEEGGYGHPDHIMAHKITLAAWDAAGDAARYGEAGAPWTPLKLYYMSFRRAHWLKVWQVMREQGIKTPLDDENFDATGWVDDPRITTAVDVRQYVPRKLAALVEHRTQIRADWPWLMVPDNLRDEVLNFEYFILVASRVPLPPGEETDLFAGVEDDRR